VAQQSVADAQLTSPIEGVVASVGMSVGGTVTANESADAIEIIGTESFEVTGSLTTAQVVQVKVGDPATVTVDGTTGQFSGTVSQVGPVQSSDSSYTYPVVIAFSSTVTGLFAGSSASVAVLVAKAHDVVAVPTSALHTIGTISYVTMITAGKPVRKDVKVGVVGDLFTQVLSGLKVGDVVVLADLSEPVPSSNTDTFGSTGFTGFGGGGFGGAGGATFKVSAGGGGFGG
jgi:hypothetical protein